MPIAWLIALGVLLVIATGATLAVRAEAKVNQVALSQAPKPVTVIEAEAAFFRGSRSYVGTIEPWVEAKIGPQLISAYIDTVLVRPGAVVKRGDVIATLDCRNANAASRSVAMQARALAARQEALADEATRFNGLLDGGFVSENDVEQKSAQSAAERAQLLAAQAQLQGSALQVDDCVLRAPFAGEVATRSADPGAFAHPGVAIVSIVDRSTVRIVADAPEVDFPIVAPGVKVHIHVFATGERLDAVVSRRAPVADPATRTARFEMDVAGRERPLPTGTTADIHIEIGEPEPAVEIPLSAATVRGEQATLFTVEGRTAHQRTWRVLGERAGRLFLEPHLLLGARVVSEGRALLRDGDHVQATPAPAGQP